MSQKYEKLKSLLKELFQLDQPDLDFGLYRIMHAKADEVTQFLDRDLLPQVKQEFGQYKTSDKADIEQQLAKAIEQAQSLGADPETLPKVKDLREKLKTGAVDIASLEVEVYDHLINFFSRYYSEGDFLSKRRYSRDGRYAIPYDGEEVKLHWANHDQYYIKTSEYLRDYAFRLNPSSEANPTRVHFRLVDAAEGEHGNIKPPNGKDRVFILASSDFISLEEGELSLRFEYRPATLTDWPEEVRQGKTKPPAQKDLTDTAEKRILAVKTAALLPWIVDLAKPHIKADGEKADYTRLRAHLNRYVARNTFDYFIHKDLGGFLRRELDFYIKNEVMQLDDVENESAPRVEQYLSKIKVIRRVASKVITFLAQLEDFQKTLWLKKKFVVETHYAVALRVVPDDFLPDIVANEAQWAEWESLHHLSEIGQEEGLFAKNLKLKSAEFLKANPSLMIDTRHFDDDVTVKLLEALGDLDEKIVGELFHSENFQALSLMQARYREMINCVYIDPPYNTDASAIDYKNGYKSSSWMSLLSDRISRSRHLLTPDGNLIAAIDDEQQRELSFILTDHFYGHLLGTICVRANPSGRPTQTGYSVSHEYLIFAGKSAASAIGRMPPTEEQMSRFNQKDETGVFEWRNLRREGSGSDRSERPTMYYPIYIEGGHIRVPQMRWNPEKEEWVIEEGPIAKEQVVWPDNKEGIQKRWRWEWATVATSLSEIAVRRDSSGRDYVYCKRRPHDDGVVSVSSWFDAKYSATEHGTALLKALFGQSPFSYPKSIHAVVDAIYIGGAGQQTATVLDYFGGSGTTGHAVINLNRRDGGQRRFVLVETGHHFDTVLIPRLKKVSFTPEWKDGRPKRSATAEEIERGPRIFKIVRLESYEDTINNLEVKRTSSQQSLLDHADAQGSGKLREQYLLRYMLKVETIDSPSLLNVTAFSDPTAYRLLVKRPGSEESREVCVDLIETFNWLLGLTVQHIAVPQIFSSQFERDAEKRLRLKNRIKTDKAGPYWFRTITGTMPDDRKSKTLIIWRKLTGNPEEDNLVLDEWFTKQGYSSKDSEFGLIYVNGGNNLENLKTPDDTWKVRLIEDHFQRLMFATEGQ